MGELKFSIVIPTYNRESLIPLTLQTVVKQRYQRFEVLIVDNCSTDNTQAVVQPFLADPRFKFIVNEKNFERGYSRNRGMQLATGDFLTFLDSDDFMSETCLEDAAEFARNSNRKIFHNRSVLKNSEGKALYHYSYPPVERAQEKIVEGNFLSCIGVFIDREIYQNYRFDIANNLTGTEDWDFWLRILARYPLGRIEKENSIIIEHSARTVNNPRFAYEILEKKKRVIEKVENDPELRKVYGRYIGKMYAAALLYSGHLAVSHSDPRAALRFTLEALYRDPSFLFNKRPWSVFRRLF